MAISSYQKGQIPFREKLADMSGLISAPWQEFFRYVKAIIDPLGVEKIFTLVNNQSSAADVVGLLLGSSQVSQVIIEYLVQRVTTSTGATELIESGVLHAVYNPTSEDWSIFQYGTPGPDDAGITFSILATGQVQYTTSNITGTPSISKLIYRTRSLGAKTFQYSKPGPIG